MFRNYLAAALRHLLVARKPAGAGLFEPLGHRRALFIAEAICARMAGLEVDHRFDQLSLRRFRPVGGAFQQRFQCLSHGDRQGAAGSAPLYDLGRQYPAWQHQHSMIPYGLIVFLGGAEANCVSLY
jgi:hypothetical protein